MSSNVPPSRQALREALVLSEDILRNIELNEMRLANVALEDFETCSAAERFFASTDIGI